MKKTSYPTDVNDEEWAILEPFFPKSFDLGRKRENSYRDIYNGINYVLRSGCAWAMIPHDFPTQATCYHYFQKWKKDGTWDKMHDSLREQCRIKMGRTATPTAAVLDSKSVKSSEKGGASGEASIGYDAGKKIKGRKQHILVDNQGFLLECVVHGANIQDREGAKLVLEKCKSKYPALKRIWADGGYAGKLIEWVEELADWTLEIVKRSDDTQGFELLPHRWVVERTFGWLGRCRRLVREYEVLPSTTEAWIKLAMTRLMLRRLTA